VSDFFFELPPPLPEAEDEGLPGPWFEPPHNVLGTAVPLQLVIAQTDAVPVAVDRATAYPSGVDLTVTVRRRTKARRVREHFPFGSHFDLDDDLRDDVLRFGVQFADGRKATSLEAFPSGDEDPAGPVLTSHGARGGGSLYESGFWLYPLPPPGALAFVCEWPSEGISLSRVEIDASLIREAAEKAKELWEDESRSAGGG
jgi:hypothetical protein